MSDLSSVPLEDTPQNTTEDEVLSEPNPSLNKTKQRRIRNVLLFLPYFLGVVWTTLHPIVSVITGELKCRGWFLDEHSIEIRFADRSSLEAAPTTADTLPLADPQQSLNLCQSLWKSHPQETDWINLDCHTHGDYFQMVSIVPLSNAVDPVEEAVVFVISQPYEGEDWLSSSFHRAWIRSLHRLANPVETPWLAKTFILVTPIGEYDRGGSSSLLDTTVSYFLQAYLGTQPHDEEVAIPLLPPRLSPALLRALVVVDVEDRVDKPTRRVPGGKTTLAILPQGRNGVLPNLDLVFLVGQLFTRASFLQPRRYPGSRMIAHPHSQASDHVRSLLSNTTALDAPTRTWAQNLADLGLFAYTMAQGPFPPHATALQQGIDAVTIHVQWEGSFAKDPAHELVQCLVWLLRALANLYERLHHSYTLYLLPNPTMFVSHMEYFLPNILVLLPLAIRSFGFVLLDMEGLHLSVMGGALLTALATMGVSTTTAAIFSDSTMIHTILIGWYMLVGSGWRQFLRAHAEPKDNRRAVLQSLQFIVCVLTAHILAPVAFAHTSLSYLPSLLWTPLLAWPDYSQLLGGTKEAAASTNKSGGSLLSTVGSLFLWIMSTIPILMVLKWDSFTLFMQLAYIPVNVLFFLLVWTRASYAY
eukprot:Nitzschia sp. Nitz4//scaffold205_size38804//10399//12324//NITZ4_007641-RA/size38804-processed-gene-0.17-mRNA-1//-1//CDS//3329541504//4437//frame0